MKFLTYQAANAIINVFTYLLSVLEMWALNCILKILIFSDSERYSEFFFYNFSLRIYY